ncbi:hypothetical protein [Fulvivirga sedimenti]|uniref:Lipocalin-like domain-containing protein n=1 Tax=Fulvivirga sedimenti TaxID=2879465 RepID=A0A9X1L1Y2_9BACT|nr:hypothetical protein [Fulvivirga sedimenti]MCA6078722.1 hypothetical protein [Fulvivirga sedimenti]
MKYVLSVVILFSIFTDLFCQTTEELEGTWKVIEVSINDTFYYDAATKTDLTMIADALVGSFIVLVKSGRADFSTRVPQLYVENARWKYDEEEGTLRFLEKRKKEVVTEFIVAGRGDRLLFQMVNSPFILSAEKVKK